VIKITGLNKDYPGDVQALRDINLEINKGEFVVLLGPSGAGKSTLLRCINGLVKPTSGQVEVNGVRVEDQNGHNLRRLRREIGMVFQQFNLVKRLRVLDNVLCGRLAYTSLVSSCCRLFSHRDIELAMSCLERVGLRDKAYQRADQLSGGQQQRVGIARALVQQPEVLLADEPIASLDPRSSHTVMAILEQINRQDHITVIVSLHDVDVAMEFARRILGIRGGRVVMDKPATQVTRKDLDFIYDDMPGERLGYTGTYGRIECAHA
jgi:phosphonate transport system ATP-binding protein